MCSETICDLRGITKRFPGVLALEGVDLSIRRGEIHALVGENGAGKSTLIKIIAGIHTPDSGDVSFEGTPLRLSGPLGARALGIAVAHQELELFGQLSVAENCHVQSALPVRLGAIRWREVGRRAQAALVRVGARVPPQSPVRLLSASERQLVEIAGTLLERPKLIVLDEPTAALSGSEAQRLFAILADLRRAGTAVIYVSHRLAEVFAVADRITVFRDGRVVWSRPAAETGEPQVVEAMVGRRLETLYPTPAAPLGDALLEIRGLSDPQSAFRDVSFEVRAGEILGLYGLVGSGRSECGQAVAGLRPAVGAVRCGEARGPFRSARAALAAGVAYLPEDRLRQGNLQGLSLRENLTVSALPDLSRAGFVAQVRERRLADDLCRRLDIRAPHIEAAIETLSGGTQQKALMGRWLARKPRVLILDEPTRGIDVGAKAEIHRHLAALADRGHAVVLISSELPEVIGMSHRIAVFREGRIARFLDSGSATEEAVGRAALPEAGAAPASPPRAGTAIARLLSQREAALAISIAVIAALMGRHTPSFLGADSLRDMAANSAALAVAATGMTFVIASGAIDISVGSVLALAAAGSAFAARAGWGIPLAFVAATAIGMAAGLANAAASAVGRLHPIITTLGTMGIFRGAFLLWTGGSWLALPDSMLALATGGPAGVPVTVLGAAAVLAAAFLFSRFAPPARRMLMLGDNPEAAALYGVGEAPTRALAFAWLGGCAGLAAVFSTARFGQVQSTTGVGYELEVIAAAVIGGANIQGGRGTVLGAALGAALIGLLNEARAVVGIHERWQLIGVGSLMLAAIAFETVLARLAGGRR